MAVASLRVAPRHWVYLDDVRTHEVHAEVEAQPNEARFVTTEFPAGARDPAEAIQSVRRVDAEPEVQRLLSELEMRLRLSGTYFRADAADMRWSPLGPPPSTMARVDLRGVDIPIPGAATPGAKMSFHHFHSPEGKDLLLISMPRLDIDESKHALAELAFKFPRVDVGDLRLVHTRLTTGTLRSSLVRRHLELPRDGFAKLLEPKDYEAAYGEDWLAQTRGMFGSAATRMIDAGGVPPGLLMTRGGGEAPASLAEVVRALGTRRIAALKARYMGEGEAELCVAAGEHVIRRTVIAKRKAIPHTASYDISVLEAALLCEYAIRQQVWSLLEEESNKVARYVHGYV